tara:strand:- start:206 stop:430 length:225 start_codon:yes stop_codon:yes gene_type:complete
MFRVVSLNVSKYRAYTDLNNKGEDAMPNKVKWKSVDRSTFYVYDAVVYQPPLVTVGDRPVDRSDDGRWGGEVRD